MTLSKTSSKTTIRFSSVTLTPSIFTEPERIALLAEEADSKRLMSLKRVANEMGNLRKEIEISGTFVMGLFERIICSASL